MVIRHWGLPIEEGILCAAGEQGTVSLELRIHIQRRWENQFQNSRSATKLCLTSRAAQV